MLRILRILGGIVLVGLAAWLALQPAEPDPSAPEARAPSPEPPPNAPARPTTEARGQSEVATPQPAAVKPALDASGPYPRTARSMLALSWQPSFCQTHRNKAECRNEDPSAPAARQFSLHGLWPDGCAYAGVSPDLQRLDQRGKWRDLPAVKLEASTARALSIAMPGRQSQLDRHEWIKHGTCDGRSAQLYYATSLALLDQVNTSALGRLFAQRVGQKVTLDEARRAMDDSFGAGAGASLVMKCKGKLIEEIRIRLGRPLTPQTDIARVVQPNRARSCRDGIVDAAG